MTKVCCRCPAKSKKCRGQSVGQRFSLVTPSAMFPLLKLLQMTVLLSPSPRPPLTSSCCPAPGLFALLMRRHFLLNPPCLSWHRHVASQARTKRQELSTKKEIHYSCLDTQPILPTLPNILHLEAGGKGGWGCGWELDLWPSEAVVQRSITVVVVTMVPTRTFHCKSTQWSCCRRRALKGRGRQQGWQKGWRHYRVRHSQLAWRWRWAFVAMWAYLSDILLACFFWHASDTFLACRWHVSGMSLACLWHDF